MTPDLADRVRVALRDQRRVREVAMFGGRAFMINDKLAVSAGRDGDLLVRCSPGRTPELLTRPGAGAAQMGRRRMAAGWIRVAGSALGDDAALVSWIAEALDHNAADR